MQKVAPSVALLAWAAGWPDGQYRGGKGQHGGLPRAPRAHGESGPRTVLPEGEGAASSFNPGLSPQRPQTSTASEDRSIDGDLASSAYGAQRKNLMTSLMGLRHFGQGCF